MKQIRNWSGSVAFFAFCLGTFSGAIAANAKSSELPSLQIGQEDSLQMAQGLRGQCRQANRNLFIYRSRSLSDPISAVAENEQVILAEETARDGWIAVTSPTTGFVQAPYLKLCDRPASPAPLPPLPPPPPPNNAVSNPSSLCRRAIYPGFEGIAVRSGPGINFPRVGGVFFDDRVTINPTATQLDSEGREWLRMIAPVNGWSSDGFPAFGESNFGDCF